MFIEKIWNSTKKIVQNRIKTKESQIFIIMIKKKKIWNFLCFELMIKIFLWGSIEKALKFIVLTQIIVPISVAWRLVAQRKLYPQTELISGGRLPINIENWVFVGYDNTKRKKVIWAWRWTCQSISFSCRIGLIP